MSASYCDTGASPLEVFGIGAEEERAYRLLLSLGTATAEGIAHHLGLPLRKTQRVLDAIATKGLATHSPERPRRYIAASPDIAIQALAFQNQQAVQSAQRMIPELQKHMRTVKEGGSEQVVELITSRHAGRQVFEQMLRSAQHEVAALVRPPVLYNPFDEPESQKLQQDMEATGVRRRSINDAEYILLPGAAERIRAEVKGGEDARVFPSLPFKMVLVDRRLAIIPLNPNQADNPTLIVRYSALLDALYTLFEILWERSTPISFKHSGGLEVTDRASLLPEETDGLISLLAVGLPDKAVATELDMSARTFNRRIAELMKSLDASTRFQLGWLCALRLSEQSPPR